MPLTLVPNHDEQDVPPSVTAVVDLLSVALHGRVIPSLPARPKGDTASPDEGLALVQGYIAIRDPQVRQAILHAVAALAATERS